MSRTAEGTASVTGAAGAIGAVTTADTGIRGIPNRSEGAVLARDRDLGRTHARSRRFTCHIRLWRERVGLGSRSRKVRAVVDVDVVGSDVPILNGVVKGF